MTDQPLAEAVNRYVELKRNVSRNVNLVLTELTYLQPFLPTDPDVWQVLRRIHITLDDIFSEAPA